MGNLVNRDFEPALAQAGDTVNVPIPPVMTANNPNRRPFGCDNRIRTSATRKSFSAPMLKRRFRFPM